MRSERSPDGDGDDGGGLAARGPIEVDGIEAADVSFPGFVPTLIGLGASIEVVSA